MVFYGGEFLGQFQGFLITLGVPIAAWCGIMLADIATRRRDYADDDLYTPIGRYGDVRWLPVLTMIVATGIGWGLVTNTFASWLTWQGYLLGPFGLGGKTGDWAFANLGVLVALVAGFVVQRFAGRGRRTPAGDDRLMVLALIDLQRIFADPDSGWATPGFDRVIEPTKALIELFAPHVVFTRFVAPEKPAGAWVPYYEAFPFALQPPDADDYQLVDEFKGAPTLDKTTFSAWGPELAARSDGRLVLGGVSHGLLRDQHRPGRGRRRRPRASGRRGVRRIHRRQPSQGDRHHAAVRTDAGDRQRRPVAMMRRISLKHERVAAVLAREIRSGVVRRGAQLPGEVELARRFSVSRNTVRAALAVLAEDDLITTRTGKGSFVLFDGRPLDGRLGWTHALSEQGVETRMRTVRIALAQDPDLADRAGLESPDVIVIERVRQLTDGTAISLERSRIPALDALRDLPGRGLDNGSISTTLNRAGLYLDHCEQRLRGRPLSPGEAELLRRPEGAWFLHTTRTSWTADDRFAEYADELLDPEHYELSLSYGT